MEAARAGEAGKGFNVVAKEIGDLAGTVSEMAAEISEMCENINTAKIAEKIQAQSDDNKELVVQLENIIKEFG